MVTVVEEKHIRARDGPITKGKDYFVKYGSKFLEANVLATGTSMYVLMYICLYNAHWYKYMYAV